MSALASEQEHMVSVIPKSPVLQKKEHIIRHHRIIATAVSFIN